MELRRKLLTCGSVLSTPTSSGWRPRSLTALLCVSGASYARNTPSVWKGSTTGVTRSPSVGISGAGMKKNTVTKHRASSAHQRAEALENGPLPFADIFARTPTGKLLCHLCYLNSVITRFCKYWTHRNGLLIERYSDISDRPSKLYLQITKSLPFNMLAKTNPNWSLLVNIRQTFLSCWLIV